MNTRTINTLSRSHSSTYEIAVRCLGKGKRQGAEIMFKCPHPQAHKHQDKNPSLRVNTNKDCWYCFPCASGGGYWKLASFISGIELDNKKAIGTWMTERGL